MTVWYETDCVGKLVVEYPNGTRVRTTWTQVGLIESLIQSLREAYEQLLLRAADAGDAPVQTLLRIDDLLSAVANREQAPACGSQAEPSRPWQRITQRSLEPQAEIARDQRQPFRGVRYRAISPNSETPAISRPARKTRRTLRLS